MIGVTEAHLCQERKAEVSEDTPLSEDTGNDPSFICMKIPYQYPFLSCQCNTPWIDIAVFAQL